MTNMLKIALNLNEEFLASVIVAYNDLCMDEDLVIFIIKNEFFDVLKYVFAFDRNYIGIREDEDSLKISLRSLI